MDILGDTSHIFGPEFHTRINLFSYIAQVNNLIIYNMYYNNISKIILININIYLMIKLS